MRKNIFKLWMLAAAVLLALGITSCAEHDNPVDPNPLADQVKGIWWTLFDQEGTTATGKAFTRVGTGFQLLEDGTGYGATFYFNNDEGDPIEMRGGKDFTPFTYTTSQDGTITLHFEKGYQPDVDYFKGMTLRYQDGHISLASPRFTTQLELANEQVAAIIEQWDQTKNGGLEPKQFNANTDFTASTWRSEQWIYIYDGVGTDHETKKGFTIIPLPWNKDQRESNMSQNFCDDITPENGWELALNYCGRSPLTNYNYFALYNKYTGTLRFFTYIPRGLNVSDANDHMWQVNTGKGLSNLLVMRYGIPGDKTLKDKAAIGQSGVGFTQYVTPWVNSYTSDGYVMPAPGWWAFDIDLSMYRPGTDVTKDFITLTMRSWNSSHVSLYSTITAGINGDMKLVADKADEKSVCSIGGVEMSTKTLPETGSSIINMFKGAASGDFGSMLGGIVGLGKNILTLAGIIPEEGAVQQSFTGKINMQLDGKVNTDGLITGSRAVLGMVNPSISFDQFDLKNSHVGQGVWNLKTSPVVYRVRDATLASGVGYNNIYTDNRNHPYNGFMTTENYDGEKCLNLYSMPTFLDPSSVEVELNPEVFPESEIEWMKVDAMCGWRPSKGFDGTDDYRKAYGLSGRGYPGTIVNYWPRNYLTGNDQRLKWNNPLCDFLHNSSDKQGMSYPFTTPLIKTYSDFKAGAYGRGNSQYILEPQVMYGKQLSSNVSPEHIMPALEVTVIVTVKMKGMSSPLLLSRTYLPEYKTVNCGYDNLMALYNNIKGNMLHAPRQKLSELNQYQIDRIKSIAEWMEGFEKVGNYVATAGTGGI